MMRRVVLLLLPVSLFLVGACRLGSAADGAAAPQSAEPQSERASIQESHQQHMATVRDLVAFSMAWYAEQGRWPRTGNDLKAEAEKVNMRLDLSTFSKLSLQPQRDGTLSIRYQLAPPYEGTGTISVPRPVD